MPTPGSGKRPVHVLTPLTFDDDYFNNKGYSSYQNFPHFAQRAQWISQNLSGSILEIGCAHGYLMTELKALGVIIQGVDRSSYVESQKESGVAGNITIADIKDMVLTKDQYDWIISWNVLDCLSDDVSAQETANVLNGGSINQLHIISMSGDHFIAQGYFIRDYNYWRALLPDAVLIRYEDKRVYNPAGKSLSKIPLCWGLVSE